MSTVDGFRFHRCDHMVVTEGTSARDGFWGASDLRAFGDLTITPHAAVLSYGLGVFEGLKARRSPDGRVLLFRPEANGERMQRSGARLGLPPLPTDRFVRAVERVADANRHLIPAAGEGTFYIRPLLHAIDPMLGLTPSRAWRFLAYGSPVGSYFPGTAGEGLRLRLLDQSRCARGGTGAAKAIGNYAGGIQVAHRWRLQGFDDVLYLDEDGGVGETSGSNLFARLADGSVVTPPLSDQILAGITRDSVLRLLRESLQVPVAERRLDPRELLEDAVEVFCTGTAWTVRAVGEIVSDDGEGRYLDPVLQPQLLETLQAIQGGTAEDRFGWVREVPR